MKMLQEIATTRISHQTTCLYGNEAKILVIDEMDCYGNEVRCMDKNDLAEKIYRILIEEGQHNLNFKLGETIRNTPAEVRDIIRSHIDKLT